MQELTDYLAARLTALRAAQSTYLAEHAAILIEITATMRAYDHAITEVQAMQAQLATCLSPADEHGAEAAQGDLGASRGARHTHARRVIGRWFRACVCSMRSGVLKQVSENVAKSSVL